MHKDVISWNAIIGGYARHNPVEDAMGVFNQMRREGMQANAITYLSILKACASPTELKWGRKRSHVYQIIRQDGFTI
jgi:pentatricopeptide repeat protein